MNWQTVSSLATAAGTLVLAVATFSAVRSSNRSARVAEETLLAGMRPLLVPSLRDDPTHKAMWSDMHFAAVEGGRAVVEEADGIVYLAMGLRNVGSGIALLHGWKPEPEVVFENQRRPDLSEFRRLQIDPYVPGGGSGYWESAIRDEDDAVRSGFLQAIADRQPVRIDLLYGDQQGGQRTISRFTVVPATDGGWYCLGGRHWNVDRPDPR